MATLIAIALLVFIVPGALLLYSALRPRAGREPDADANVPAARVVQGNHSSIRDRDHSKRVAIGKAVRVTAGTGLIGVGVFSLAAIYELFTSSYSKGRLLRLRGRAHLPELAEGNGWSDGTTPRTDRLSDDERRVLAAAWLTSARMEHASIAAFAQLGLHLAALGASSDLVERTHLAALDELRHARRCYALASAYAGTTWTAGSITALGHGDQTPVDFTRLAVGSLVDGCLAEGVAADVARSGSRTATDSVIQQTLAMIGDDEARHAELAWSVLTWALEAGGEPVQSAVALRVAKLHEELAPRAPDFAGLDVTRLLEHGLSDQGSLAAIAIRRIAAVRARAQGLLEARKAA